jgi:16S rRNA C967 or C1407 C5-methylase (RsmB/RsmF family)
MALDAWISRYFKEHKALGSKDRGEIAETAYGIVRWQGLLDAFIERPAGWEKRIAQFKQFNPGELSKECSLPPHVKVSFPKPLYDLILKDYGPERAEALCLASNAAAPTTVRANPLKGTREALLELWKGHFDVVPSLLSPFGIIFRKKTAFFTMPEFKQGLFEVQDEGSQLLADLVEARPGDQVMDYCAGSGGKTLAFAYKLQHRGQIYLHDIRPWALDEARKRLKRAGIQNAQTVLPEDPKLTKLAGKMDWVLVDAPCTGTGTLRRNPDMKWKFTPETLPRLLVQQREIFDKAIKLLSPKGTIVWGTCSLLNAENQEQADYFCRTYGLERVREDFQSWPSPGNMDGFYGAVMRKIVL